MICYRDITFCKESSCGKFGDKNEDCPRSLTLAVEHMAAHWWNRGEKKEDWGHAPICVFRERPDCFVSKDK